MSYSKICHSCLSPHDMELLEKEAIPEIITFCLGINYHRRETDFLMIEKDKHLPINVGKELVHIILTSDWRSLLQAFTSRMPPSTCHSLLSLSLSAHDYFWIMGYTDKQQQWNRKPFLSLNCSVLWNLCESGCVYELCLIRAKHLWCSFVTLWLKWQVLWALHIVKDAWIWWWLRDQKPQPDKGWMTLMWITESPRGKCYPSVTAPLEKPKIKI